MSGNHICHLESMQRSKSIKQREAKWSIFRSINEIQTAEPQSTLPVVTGNGRGVERVNNPINHTVKRARPNVPHFSP